jgi:predicted RNase H-like nuclease
LENRPKDGSDTPEADIAFSHAFILAGGHAEWSIEENNTMTRVMGVDGIHEGWVGVYVEVQKGADPVIEIRRFNSFKDILVLDPFPDVVAIDIPLGLLDRQEKGGRECDRRARRLLGSPRSGSVFSPPIRPALGAMIYEEAKRHGLTLQGFGILPKVREVDEQMTPELQKRIFEVHPELSFMEMNGGSMTHNKKGSQGRADRIQALENSLPGFSVRFLENRPEGVGSDDLLDAFAAAWTALRVVACRAVRFPSDPPRDVKGLRMEIWY